MRVTFAILAGLSASPALAHGGLHIHPHGLETGLLVGALAVVGLAAWRWMR